MTRIVSLIAALTIAFSSVSSSFSSKYHYTVYPTDEEIGTMSISDMIQTSDGYIYVGSDNGLYRFDKTGYLSANLDNSVTEVNCLSLDSNGVLWIGTNGEGLIEFNPENEEEVKYSTQSGLKSDIINCVCEDEEKNLFISSPEEMVILKNDGTLSTSDDSAYLSQLIDIKEMCLGTDGYVYMLDKENNLYAVKENAVINVTQSEFYNICALGIGRDGNLLAGTEEGDIYTVSAGKVSYYMNANCIAKVNGFFYDDKSDCVFVYGEGGIAEIDSEKRVSEYDIEDFGGFVTGMIKDTQGNLWVSSDGYGICRFSSKYFGSIKENYNIDVNSNSCVCDNDEYIYIGNEDGVYSVSKNEAGEAVKCCDESAVYLIENSDGDIIVIGEGHEGIIDYDTNEYSVFDNKDLYGGILLSDGRLALTGKDRIYFYNGTTLISYLDIPDIKCVCENKNGLVYVSTTTNKMYIIENDEITSIKYCTYDGCSFEVNKMTPYKDGVIYISHNGLYYDDGNEIIRLNFDCDSSIYDLKIYNVNAWICTGNGIYVAETEDMIDDNAFGYVFYGKEYGLDSIISSTANNYLDDDGLLYISCVDDIRTVSIKHMIEEECDYNLFVGEMSFDGVSQVTPSYLKEIVIPAEVNKFEFQVAALNYSPKDPYIYVYIEGFEDQGIYAYQSQLETMTYTNIPPGKYNLHICVLNEGNGFIKKEVIISIVKEANFYDLWYFKVYVALVSIYIISVMVWLLAKSGSVAELRHQLDETDKAKKEAEEANSVKSRFLARMTHELRTPINAILGMNQLMMNEEVSSVVYNYGKSIKSSGEQMLAIVNDILDFSKLEARKMTLVEREYDITEFVDNVSVVLSVSTQQKNLKYELDIDENIPKILYGDESKIHQIVLNFISNAVKYTKEGFVKLSIKSERIENNKCAITVAVADSGIGIAIKDKSRIFDSFARLDERKNIGIQGTGLGLSVCKEIAELLGSNITVESEYGKGSVFSFTVVQTVIRDECIGKYEFNSKKSVVKTLIGVDYKASGAKVLVVDDTEINIAVIRGMFKLLDVVPDVALSGSECLEKVGKDEYDIIFLDSYMPEMDGIEVLHKIKEMQLEKMPIIISFSGDVQIKEQFRELGYDDYLSKPVDGKELEEMMKKHFKKAD